ncbi:SCP-like protein [Oesophagostomum dentatum]|uniref:SCP-like protein n=1 Tax=Oesophagostomum dentatum TaxID=61180 RepID=A0A0B1TVB9_OESDE|nr:SCP-like protein [Oesophagostomum dentatum]
MTTSLTLTIFIIGVLPAILLANTLCPNSTLENSLQQKFLNMHNIRRSALAKGTVVKVNKNKLPKGSDILKMEINCTLEEAAVAVAENCFSNSSTLDPGVTESRAKVPLSKAPNLLKAIEKGVSSWWKQIRTTAPNIGNKVYYRSYHSVVKEFVQMAWGSTNQLGCAVNQCSNFYAVVCQYSPSELVENTQIYTPGQPCKNCPTGYTKCSDALCSA